MDSAIRSIFSSFGGIETTTMSFMENARAGMTDGGVWSQAWS